MIAYKGFNKGLRCRGYQFTMGLNVTEKAKAVACGFHCAEDPLDCLSYYPDMESSEYYVVDAAGDVNEDGRDTKIACTELTIIKKMTKEELVLHALAYMTDHPKRPSNHLVERDRGQVRRYGFVIVRGEDPVAKGRRGDLLAFAKENTQGQICEVALVTVDGKKVKENKWYGVDLTQRQVAEDE